MNKLNCIRTEVVSLPQTPNSCSPAEATTSSMQRLNSLEQAGLSSGVAGSPVSSQRCVEEKSKVSSTSTDAYAPSPSGSEVKKLASGYCGQKVAESTTRSASASAYRSSTDMSSENEREEAYKTLLKLKQNGVLTEAMFERLAQPLLSPGGEPVEAKRPVALPDFAQIKESKPYDGSQGEAAFKAAKRAASSKTEHPKTSAADPEVANEAAFKAAKRAKMEEKEEVATPPQPKPCATKPKESSSEPPMTMKQVVEILKRHFYIAASSEGDRGLISRKDLESLQSQPAVPNELKRAARFLLENKAFFNDLEIKGCIIKHHDGQIALGDLNAYKA
ncbi:MAG: hypothetical protein EP343_22580 [Deltaproteobacteria bacterium]|nr:MAG: hypothetical protein EP343_22580 [Deltaproteobacteria bacterium]